MTTTHASMTDRYIAAALKGVPAHARKDAAADLRTSIAEAIGSRIRNGESADVAEREVLTNLGDPMRVAAEHSGRPLYLIGPELYRDYIRLLKLLLAIVVPTIAVVVGVATTITGASLEQVVVSTTSAAFNVGLQLAFWVTLVFAILDRRGVQPRIVAWDVGDLPETPGSRVTLGETVASICGLTFVIWLLLWRPGYQETLGVDGPSVPILDPALSSFWVPFLVSVLLASIALEIVKYRKGNWTIPLAATNTLLNLAFAIPAIWLASTDRLLNPAFLSSVAAGEFPQAVEQVPTLIAWVIFIICTIDIGDGWWKALHRRDG